MRASLSPLEAEVSADGTVVCKRLDLNLQLGGEGRREGGGTGCEGGCQGGLRGGL